MHTSERTLKTYHLDIDVRLKKSGQFDFPIIKPCGFIPERIIPFNVAKTSKDYSAGIHFFIDDYQFERIWRNPNAYLPRLSKFSCVFAPDFSLYLDMPYPMKIWNVYRNRLIGAWMQKCGLNVIPTVSWSDCQSFDYCFEGLPKHSTLAVSSMECKGTVNSHRWNIGMHEMISALAPNQLLIYGHKVDYDFNGINVIYYESYIRKRFKEYERQ